MKTYEAIDRQHKALLFMASAIVKTFLMAVVSSYAFCGSTDPNVLFSAKCYGNIPFVAGSTGAVATMSTLFGYYIVRLRAFDSIFARVMKTDFIITSMYFAVAFSAPSIVAAKVMVWLFGMWILGMLLAPLNKQMTSLKRITE